MTLDEIRQQIKTYTNFVDNSKIIMLNVSNKISFNKGN